MSEATKFHPSSPLEEIVIEADRNKYLRMALVLVGLIFIVGIYTLGPVGRGTLDSPITCRITCR